MQNDLSQRVHEIPAPAAKEAGWYPDPLGSTAERYWDGAWLELTRVPKAGLNGHLRQSPVPKQGWKRLRLALAGRPQPLPGPVVPAATSTTAPDKSEKKRSSEVEKRKRAFFESPAGRARLCFGRKQRVFQCEIDLWAAPEIVIPGVEGTAPQSTSDTVEILNSVVAEGWKLVAGSFVYAEMRGGPVGIYLFKRSKKRRRQMNDPWKS
jgi:Protein of unknown function (DUF2510)